MLRKEIIKSWKKIMSKSESEGRKNQNWLKWGVIINFIMLIAVLIGILNINITIPSFDKKEYEIFIIDEQISSTLLPHLRTSPNYYIELKVDSSSEIDYSETLEFSVNTIDKGKIPVKNPEFRIFIVDLVGNVRGLYPKHSINLMQNNFTNSLLINDDFEIDDTKKKINFYFKMPPEDQKAIGNWKVFVYLFDKNTEMLVSYNVFEFKVQEKKSTLFLQLYILSIILILVYGSTGEIKMFFKQIKERF